MLGIRPIRSIGPRQRAPRDGLEPLDTKSGKSHGLGGADDSGPRSRPRSALSRGRAVGAFPVHAGAPHCTSGLALIAIAGLAGCSATTSFLAEPRETGVQFTSRRVTEPVVPAGLERPASSQLTTQRRLPLISLYGELLDHSAGAGGPFDGSSNVSQITFATEGACTDPDIDPEGKWMVFASTQHRATSDIYVKPISGRTLTQLTNDPADDVMPAIHPSGKSIAFASNRASNWDIYVMSMDGGQPMQITDEPEPELHPSWSPDGTKLIYCKLGSMSGRWEVWVVDIENPGVRRFLAYGLFPQWGPDIARPKILLQRSRQRGSRFFSIWTVDYVNDNAIHPTEIVSAGNAAVINPNWSPDGNRIVFVTVVEPGETTGQSLEQSDIWIVKLDGSGRTNLTNGMFANYQPAWGTDGRVYFVSDRSGVDNVWSVTTSRALDAIGLREGYTSAMSPDLEP